MEIGLLILAFIVIAILGRLFSGTLDEDRVERTLCKMGFELIDSKRQTPDSRSYEVVYLDPAGRLHQAHVETSFFKGIHLTNDRLIEEPHLSTLEEQRTRLVRFLANRRA